MRFVVAILLLVSSVVQAEELDPFDAPHGTNARGSKLFIEGRALLKDGKIDSACVRFADSWAIEQALGTQLNLAHCRELQGKLHLAWELYAEAALRATAQRDSLRAKFAGDRANALLARLAILEIRLDTPIASGTTLTVDGGVQATQPVLEVRVDPREVTVAATGPTGVMSSLKLTPTPGTRTILEVPRLHERAREVSVGRLLLAAAFIGLGVVAVADEHRVIGGITIGIGALIGLSGPTRRGPVRFPITKR